MKRVTSIISAAALALAVSASPSVASKDSDTAAGLLALGLLGALIAHDQGKNRNRGYVNDRRLSREENAIGRCMGRGRNLVESAGGYEIHLERVNSVRAGSGGKISVSMIVTGYYPTGEKTSDVICTVKRNRITSFVNN